MKQTPKPSSPSRLWSQRRRRNILLMVCGAVCCFAAEIAGILIGKTWAPPPLQRVMVLCLVLPVVLALFSRIDSRRCLRRYTQLKVAEAQEMLREHRENAEASAQELLARLRRARTAADILAVVLVALALFGSFLTGLFYSVNLSTPLWFLTSFYAAAGLTRIRFREGRETFTDGGGYVGRADYPELYAIADRAASTIHCPGPVHIALLPDENAGIAKVGGDYSIQLGTQLLTMYTPEELYAVLLHEFAHMEDRDALKEMRFADWLNTSRDTVPISGILWIIFFDSDVQYTIYFTLYQYAASVRAEAAADRAMVEFSSPEAAASALLKLKYLELYDWETSNREGFENLDDRLAWIVYGKADAFLAALPERKAFWDTLAEKEILANNATHPTTKMRLEALGVKEFRLVGFSDSEAWCSDVAKARSTMLAHMKELNEQSDYNDILRKSRKLVTDWETDGKPLVVEEYSDVINALRDLGRLDEALALCDRAIADLPLGTPVSFPSYYKGCALLHQWDESGIELIYRAIAGSSNYIEEGLDQIGIFCCLTGNQAELDRYRAKAVELMQKQQDVYSELSVLRRSDDLRQEHLPEDLQDRLLRYILSFENGQIEKLYLVRKTINDAFFTSVLIVQFTLSAEPDAKQEIMHRIFNALDKDTEWQFSLFDYDEVQKIPFDEIPGAVIYQKETQD